MPGRSGIDTQLRAAKTRIRLLIDDRELAGRLSTEGRNIVEEVRTDLVAVRNEGDSVSELRVGTRGKALDEDFLLRLKTADRLMAEISRIEASAGSQAGMNKPDLSVQIEELSNRLRSVCRYAGAGRNCPLSKILCHVKTLFMKLKV
jgi:hypothetical protein